MNVQWEYCLLATYLPHGSKRALYRTITFCAPKPIEHECHRPLSEIINALGTHGWELTGVGAYTYAEASETDLYFKRQVHPDRRIDDIMG